MKNHPLVNTLLTLWGNPRACVYTEPLWVIPYNLYLPFFSVYMAALSLSDSQIGFIASVSMFSMAVFAKIGGPITDKLGRKLTTLIFDILAWSVPTLLWAFSQNFWWFLVAAAFNGIMQVTSISWTCLLVEDAEKSLIARIYFLIHLIGQFAVVFAPLAAITISHFSVVPVMRVLLFVTFASMTTKFILLYRYSEETETGKVRRAETSGVSMIKLILGSGGVFKRVIKSPGMMLALVISTTLNVISMVSANFFALYTTGPLELPEHILAYFPIVRSLTIVIFLFFFQSRILSLGFKRPMLAGIMLYVVGHLILLLAPVGYTSILVFYIFIEACAFSLVVPNKDSLVALLIDPDERARISGLLASLVLCFSVPFGYFAGMLSDVDRRLPFVLNILLFALLFAAILAGGKYVEQKASD